VNGRYTPGQVQFPGFAMSIRASLRFALLLALLLLAACGNKGPLVKPAAPPQDAPATTP
jgi:hypothetical protein